MAEPSAGAGVRFTEAIEALRSRLNISSAEWREIWTASGTTAREAAGTMSASMMRELMVAIAEVMESGGTLQDFRRDYDRIVAARGYASPRSPGWHSDLVFRLHTQSAYAAGRWEQAQRRLRQNPNLRLFARYITIGDHRVRPTHALWHGVILPIGHAFWLTHWPPNGFNCRCHVQIITERDMKRYGWSVTADADRRLAVPPDKGFEGNPGITRGKTGPQAPPAGSGGNDQGELFPGKPLGDDPRAVALLGNISDDVAELAAELGVFDDPVSASRVARSLIESIPEPERADLQVRWEEGDEPGSISFAARTPGAIIHRTFLRDESDRLTVAHNYFWIDKRYQGGGHAKVMMRQALDLYESLGVERVTVHANIDVGGYAWARLGFEPDDPWALRDELWRRIAALRDEVDPGVDEAYLDQAERELDQPGFAYRIARGPLGKALLMNSDWYGTIDLTDPDALRRAREAAR